jgi:hypothetical protein
VLQRRAETWPSSKGVTEAIECFWREHGAPSVEVVHAFLEEAASIDAGSNCTGARHELLRRWVEQCGTRSRATRALEWAQLAVCFAVRRARPGNDVPARTELAYLWHETVRAG